LGNEFKRAETKGAWRGGRWIYELRALTGDANGLKKCANFGPLCSVYGKIILR
jgi:hypothetical protein